VNYIWLPDIQRYRDLDTGRFLPRATVQEFAAEAIRASDNVVSSLSQMVADGLLDVSGWESMMRQELKTAYIQEYILGRGGLAQMTQADWGSIGGMLSEQYKYLDKFALEVADGQLSEIL